MAGPFEWNFADMLSAGESRPTDGSEFALILLNQPLRADEALISMWENARVRVAADGGANRLYDLLQTTPELFQDSRMSLDAIVGDLDSLLPSVKKYFTSLDKPAEIVQILDQNLYDIDKVSYWIRSNYAKCMNLVILGDLGGRVDHGLRMIHYLFLLQPGLDYRDGRVLLVTSQNFSILLKAGFHRIFLKEGSGVNFGGNIGIIPIGKPSQITTKGLEQDVEKLTIMLGERFSRDKVIPGRSMIEIEISDAVLFTIDRL